MQAPDPLEEKLARLMAPAMSAGAMRSIDTMLDELAGDDSAAVEEVAVATPGRGKVPFWLSAGIAAAVAAVAAIQLTPSANPPALADAGDFEPGVHHGLVLVGAQDRVEDLSDEGLLADPDGRTMEAVRIRVVENNFFRDEETGVMVRVSEPREEIVLTPVTAF